MRQENRPLTLEARKSSGLNHGNVLIVEDDKDTADTLVVVLASAGYGVRKVSNRDSALQVLKSNLYQCIVLDFYMPGMPAKDFMAALKRVQPLSKVLLITAANEVEVEAKKLGVTCYLGKPFENEALLKLVAQCCRAEHV